MRIRIHKPDQPEKVFLWNSNLDELDGLETYLPLEKSIHNFEPVEEHAHIFGSYSTKVYYIHIEPKKIWPDKASSDSPVIILLNWIECLEPLPPVLEGLSAHFFAVAPPLDLRPLTLTNLKKLAQHV